MEINRYVFLGMIAFAVVAHATADAASITGIPSVVDGDTIEIQCERIGLNGIDAPASDQACQQRIGETWPCGRRSAQALGQHIASRSVSCAITGIDKYRRAQAICAVGTEDLNEWMVREGWAVAYRKYSEQYITSEEQAHAGRQVIWSGDLEAPWDWRRRKTGG